MDPKLEADNLADTSKPNAGRMYDYWLGGFRNYEIDRVAANKILTLAPFTAKFVRLQRWCLAKLAIELTYNRGFDVIIDFASGLPTEDNIHFKARTGTVVIYSDWDEVTVRCAKKEILGDTPNVYYFLADARYPERLLNDPEVKRILNGRRDVAISYWGVGAFLADDDIAHAARVLYEWSGPKACWAFNAQSANTNKEHSAVTQARQIYQQMGISGHLRTLEDYKRLLRPWRIEGDEFISFFKWHGYDQTLMTDEDRQIFGGDGGGYGAYLIK